MLWRDKRGVSILIGYVLLIVIGLSLSTIVYVWLKGSIGLEEVKCPENVEVVLRDVRCFEDSESVKGINVTLENRGLRSIDGFVLRVNNRESELGAYNLKDDVENFEGVVLKPSDRFNQVYGYENFTESISAIKFVEVQPFVFIDDEKIFCESVSKFDVDC